MVLMAGYKKTYSAISPFLLRNRNCALVCVLEKCCRKNEIKNDKILKNVDNYYNVK